MKTFFAMAVAALLLSGCVTKDSSADDIDVDSAASHPECAKQFGSTTDGMARDANGQHACF
ncbi:hypothetical protein [Beijerinckia sp. L45]|uniref:hypothetical protein n=1 Tax=Beijerinckia sp. L45 TaxID=1641855 RepID=UPI00131C2EC6|nr:hypothetical protein [Beijerinckia sp. L45]